MSDKRVCFCGPCSTRVAELKHGLSVLVNPLADGTSKTGTEEHFLSTCPVCMSELDVAIVLVDRRWIHDTDDKYLIITPKKGT